MSKIIGVTFGLYCFAVVVIFGIIRKAAVNETLTRAIIALVLGALVGWLVFGTIGGAMLAASDEKPKEVKKEEGGEAET